MWQHRQCDIQVWHHIHVDTFPFLSHYSRNNSTSPDRSLNLQSAFNSYHFPSSAFASCAFFNVRTTSGQLFLQNANKCVLTTDTWETFHSAPISRLLGFCCQPGFIDSDQEISSGPWGRIVWGDVMSALNPLLTTAQAVPCNKLPVMTATGINGQIPFWRLDLIPCIFENANVAQKIVG